MQKPKQQAAPDGPRRAAGSGSAAGRAVALLAALLAGAWVHAHMDAATGLFEGVRVQADGLPTAPSHTWVVGDAGAAASAATLVVAGGWPHGGRQQLQAQPQPPPQQQQQQQQQMQQQLVQPQQRKKIRAFVGVFSSFSVPHASSPKDDDKYCYECRRAAIRKTWFAAMRSRLDEWESRHGVVVRFIVGHSDRADAQRAMDEEARLYGDIMRIPVQDFYSNLGNKTRAFFKAAAEAYDAEWVVKADDDIYLNPERLLLAMQQWDRMGAGYVGCMKHGAVWTDPGTRWYEPSHFLLGSSYYLHSYGSIYALSGRAVDSVIVRNHDSLRLLANEDTMVGLWMLAHGVQHFEDMRLCSPVCTVAIVKNECAGLCRPVQDMLELHQQPLCTRATAPREALAYHPAHPGHEEFEKMWVV